MPPALPARVSIDKPAACPGAEKVAYQSRDVDQTVDGNAEVVRRCLQHEWIEEVDAEGPGEGDGVAEEGEYDGWIDDQR